MPADLSNPLRLSIAPNQRSKEGGLFDKNQLFSANQFTSFNLELGRELSKSQPTAHSKADQVFVPEARRHNDQAASFARESSKPGNDLPERYSQPESASRAMDREDQSKRETAQPDNKSSEERRDRLEDTRPKTDGNIADKQAARTQDNNDLDERQTEKLQSSAAGSRREELHRRESEGSESELLEKQAAYAQLIHQRLIDSNNQQANKLRSQLDANVATGGESIKGINEIGKVGDIDIGDIESILQRIKAMILEDEGISLDEVKEQLTDSDLRKIAQALEAVKSEAGDGLSIKQQLASFLKQLLADGNQVSTAQLEPLPEESIQLDTENLDLNLNTDKLVDANHQKGLLAGVLKALDALGQIEKQQIASAEAENTKAANVINVKASQEVPAIDKAGGQPSIDISRNNLVKPSSPVVDVGLNPAEQGAEASSEFEGASLNLAKPKVMDKLSELSLGDLNNTSKDIKVAEESMQQKLQGLVEQVKAATSEKGKFEGAKSEGSTARAGQTSTVTPTASLQSGAKAAENVANSATSKSFSATLQAHINKPNWAPELGQRLMMMVGQKIQVAEIRLDPPDLGPMEVKIRMQQEQANVVFNSQHVAVRDALEQAVPKLRELFEENGLALGDVDVQDQTAQQKEGEDANENNVAAVEDGNDDAAAIEKDAVISSDRLVDFYA